MARAEKVIGSSRRRGTEKKQKSEKVLQKGREGEGKESQRNETEKANETRGTK